MSDNQPVAYPSLGAAYPVNKSAYPIAPPVPAFKTHDIVAEAISPRETTTAETPVEAPMPQKFFPLVPTKSSIFVSNDAAEAEVDAAVESEVATPAAFDVEAASPAAVDVENLFDISPSLTREPQTNSIVLDSIPDALTSSESFSDAGEILITGSIELPTITGEISLATESLEADVSDSLDSASVTISTVAPVRAPSVVNSKAQLGVLPSKRRRSHGQMMAMLTLGLLIVTVGTLYVMAAIVGVIK
jgi:hypothetical protein